MILIPCYFFQLDEGDRRGHDQKLFKKRLRLNVRKYVFLNRVIDNWNLLPVSCINCSTINTLKKHLSSELESEAVKFSLSVVIVGIIWRKPVLTHASIVGAGFCGMRIAECGKMSRGNLQIIKCGTFRKLPLITFPHSAAEKFRISADCKNAGFHQRTSW